MLERDKYLGVHPDDLLVNPAFDRRSARGRDETGRMAPGKRTLVDQLPPDQQHAPAGGGADALAPFRVQGVTDVFGAVIGRGGKLATQPHTMMQLADRRAGALMRKAVADGEVDAHDPAVEAALAAKGGGAALPDEVRAKMEQAFGADFGSVRVHTDGLASEASHAVSAHAFTVGEDIYFAPGMYDPQSASGQKLLAHELAHVVQHAQGKLGGERRVSMASDSHETEADAMAERAIAPRAPVAEAHAPIAAKPASAPGPVMRKAAAPAAAADDKKQKSTQPKIVASHDSRPLNAARRDVRNSGDAANATAKSAATLMDGKLAQTKAVLDQAVKTGKAQHVGDKVHDEAHKHLAEDHKHVEKHHALAAKHAAKNHHVEAPKFKPDATAGGSVDGISLKPITDWNAYMPPPLPDQDARERAHILKLVKARIGKERESSAKALANLHQQHVKAANSVKKALPAMQAKIEGGKASALGIIASSEAANVGAVNGAIASAKAQVSSKAAAVKAQITAAHQALVQQLDQTMQDALTKLQTESAAAGQQITASETATIAQVEAQFASTEGQIRAYAGSKAGQATALGASISLPYDGDKLEAARKAAVKTAGEYAEQMPEQGNKAAEDLDTHKAPAENDVTNMATQAQTSVTTAYTNSLTAIHQAHDTSKQAADAAKTAALAQAASAAASATAGLTSLGASQVAAIHQAAAGARGGVASAASAAQAQTTSSVDKAAAGLEGGAQGIAKGAKKIDGTNPADTHKTVEKSGGELKKTMSAIEAGLNKSASGAASGLVSTANGAAGGMSQTAAHAKQSAAAMAAGASQGLQQIGQSTQTGFNQIGQQGKQQIKQVETAAKTGFDGVVKSLGDSYTDALGKLTTGLSGAYASVQGSFDKAVPGQETTDIMASAKTAADAVKPWWQKALAVVAAVVVAVVVVVAVTVLTGGLGDGLLITLAVGALSGAAGSVAGSMASNLVLGNPLTQGITVKSVLMGAAGGALAAGLTSGIAAGAEALAGSEGALSGAGEALSGALEGGSGLANFGMRFATNMSVDRVTDFTVQEVFTGHYETNLESWVIAGATNGVTSTKQFDVLTKRSELGEHAEGAKDWVGDKLNIGGGSESGGGGGGGGGGEAPAPASAKGGGHDEAPAPKGNTTDPAAPTTPKGEAPKGSDAPKGEQPAPVEGKNPAPAPKGGDEPAPKGGEPKGDAPAPKGDKPVESKDPGGDPQKPADPGKGDKPPEGKPGEQPTNKEPGAPKADANGDHPAPKGDHPAKGDEPTGSAHKPQDPASDAPQGAKPETAEAKAEHAAESENAKDGYEQGTKAKADEAAGKIESGETPAKDQVRDTDANEKGRQELDEVKQDPKRAPEDKQQIEHKTGETVKGKEEPTGNLKGDVDNAKSQVDGKGKGKDEAKPGDEGPGKEGEEGKDEGGDAPKADEAKVPTKQALQDAWNNWIHGHQGEGGTRIGAGKDVEGPPGKEAALFTTMDALKERVGFSTEEERREEAEGLEPEYKKATAEFEEAKKKFAENPSFHNWYRRVIATHNFKEAYDKHVKEQAESKEKIGSGFEGVKEGIDGAFEGGGDEGKTGKKPD